jgi:glycine hydroxymethyltransferase
MCDILDGLEHGNSEQIIAEVKAKVLDICQRFPVYK